MVSNLVSKLVYVNAISIMKKSLMFNARLDQIIQSTVADVVAIVLPQILNGVQGELKTKVGSVGVFASKDIIESAAATSESSQEIASRESSFSSRESFSIASRESSSSSEESEAPQRPKKAPQRPKEAAWRRALTREVRKKGQVLTAHELRAFGLKHNLNVEKKYSQMSSLQYRLARKSQGKIRFIKQREVFSLAKRVTHTLGYSIFKIFNLPAKCGGFPPWVAHYI